MVRILTVPWTSLGSTDFEHLALQVQLVAGSYRSRPTELVNAGADNAARRHDLAFHEQPHGQRGGVPALAASPRKTLLRAASSSR